MEKCHKNVQPTKVNIADNMKGSKGEDDAQVKTQISRQKNIKRGNEEEPKNTESGQCTSANNLESPRLAIHAKKPAF